MAILTMMSRQPDGQNIHAAGQRNHRIVRDSQQNQADSTQVPKPLKQRSQARNESDGNIRAFRSSSILGTLFRCRVQ